MLLSRTPIVFAAAAFIMAAGPAGVSAQIVHGFADLFQGDFDFSTQTLVNHNGPENDISLAFVVDPPLGWRIHTTFSGSYLLTVPDTTPEVFSTASTDPAAYNGDAPIVVGLTYVIMTADGVFAKFTFRTWVPYSEAMMEYYVQLDGTPDLETPIPIRLTTWGRIKTLYDSRRTNLP